MKKQDKHTEPTEEIAAKKLSDEDLGEVNGGRRLQLTFKKDKLDLGSSDKKN